MNEVDKLLKEKGLTFEDLKGQERDVYFSWLKALEGNQLTVEKIKTFVSDARQSVEIELSEYEDVPNTWLSLLSLFLPLYGVIKKWYQDRKKIALQMRLRNYILLEAMLTSPEKAREAIKQQIEQI